MIRLATVLLTFLTMTFFMNCGQNAGFDSGDERFKSLADGQSVEVVTEEELVDIENQGDNGIFGDPGEDSGDGGLGGTYGENDDDDDESNNFPGNSGNRMGNNNNNNSEDGSESHSGGDSKDKGKSCKDRLSQQMDNGQRVGMVITPEELEATAELLEAASCKKNGNGKMKFVWVCHVPSDDFEKEKSKCLPIPALAGHIYNHLNRANGSHHSDYLGKCKSDQDEGEESEEEGGDE